MKPCVENRQVTCEPIMGPESIMRMGPAGALLNEVSSGGMKGCSGSVGKGLGLCWSELLSFKRRIKDKA